MISTLNALSQVQQKNTVDTLREKVPELLPEQGKLYALFCGSTRVIMSHNKYGYVPK